MWWKKENLFPNLQNMNYLINFDSFDQRMSCVVIVGIIVMCGRSLNSQLCLISPHPNKTNLKFVQINPFPVTFQVLGSIHTQ